MALPNDRFFGSQWHLRNAKASEFDLDVASVWSPAEGSGYTGAGVRAVVIDTGIDYTHPDLAPNYDRAGDRDLVTGGDDAFGAASESHGTAVTGIIGAARNGAGAVGVAYEATLTGYRTSPTISDSWLGNIRDAIRLAGETGDVANISQTISNDPNSQFGTGYAAARFDAIGDAIGEAVGSGRGRLGTTIVKAAGNAREDVYDISADGWGKDTRQVVVAAVDRQGAIDGYSSYGSSILVSAFGSPGEVVTTDRVGGAGYAAGNFYNNFDGTSAAAPMVAGVVALMYEAAPGLGWRDVQSILAASARHVGSAVGAAAGTSAEAEHFAWTRNHTTTWNGGGLHHSNDYGYGLVDARAAVRLAESWGLTGTPAATSRNEAKASMDVLGETRTLPDGKPAGLTFQGATTSRAVVERVTVEMTFSAAFIGDLDLYLVTPDGTTSQLFDGDLLDSGSYSGTWIFETQALRGEHADGTWTVRVADSTRGDRVTVSDIVIRTFGDATTDDRYIFTDEYSAAHGSRQVATVGDRNGGSDTVNAAAVSSDSTIRLNGKTSSIDGVATRLSGMENAIGGDGDDMIVGSDAANVLHGMRGDDDLYGRAGRDILTGGPGENFISGGEGADTLWGGPGADVMDGGGGADVLRGGIGADRFVFTALEDSPAAAAGAHDVLRKSTGAAAFQGAGAGFGDRIDLSGIDADTTVPGNQDFSFGSNARGGVWCRDTGTTTTILANVDDDPAAEFRLDILDGGVRASAYGAADFIL